MGIEVATTAFYIPPRRAPTPEEVIEVGQVSESGELPSPVRRMTEGVSRWIEGKPGETSRRDRDGTEGQSTADTRCENTGHARQTRMAQATVLFGTVATPGVVAR